MVPVRVDKLVAHLEAYVQTIPAITALRLCNRFGKGDDCHIHKLPVELVDEVEKLIIEPERERRLAVWIREMKCWSKKCYFITRPSPAYRAKSVPRALQSHTQLRKHGHEWSK